MSLTILADEAASGSTKTLQTKRALGVGEDQRMRVQNAIEALVKYIPVETVTLYMAAISAFAAIKSVLPAVEKTTLYVVFAALTPIIVWVAYLGKRRMANEPMRVAFGEALKVYIGYPLWGMFAGLVAFLAWALVVPDNGVLSNDAQGAFAGFVAIVITAFLSLLEALFGPKGDAQA
jgi:hypothetical protein